MKGTQSSTPPDMVGQTPFPSHHPIWLGASAAGSACLCYQKPASLLAVGLCMSWLVLCWHLPSLLTHPGQPYMPQQTGWCISLLVSGARTTEEKFENPHEDAPCPYSASGLGASLPSPCIPPGDALKSVSVCAGGSSTLTEENRFLCCMLLSETCGFHRRNHAEVSPDKKINSL